MTLILSQDVLLNFGKKKTRQMIEYLEYHLSYSKYHMKGVHCAPSSPTLCPKAGGLSELVTLVDQNICNKGLIGLEIYYSLLSRGHTFTLTD